MDTLKKTGDIKSDLEAYRALKQSTSPVDGVSSSIGTKTPTRDMKAELEAYRASKKVPLAEDKPWYQKVVEAVGLEKAADTFGSLIARSRATEDEKQFIKKPTGKEVAGAVLQTGSLLIPGTTFAKGATRIASKALPKLGTTAVKRIGNIATGATTGYAQDVGSSLGENKSFAEALTPGAATVIGAGVPLALPAAKVVGKGIRKVGDVSGDVLIGSQGKKALGTAMKNPRGIEAFKKGRTLQSVADRTTQAIEKFSSDSKKQFNVAIDLARDDIQLTPKQFTKNISSVLKENRIDLSPAERGVVNRAKMFIKTWKDFSPKGIIKLRQELDRRGFYKSAEGYENSNSVINALRKRLNAIAISMDDSIAPALEKASFDIEYGNKLGHNILGNTKLSVEATANKLRTILNNINDPVEKQATKDLFEFLKSRTGEDILPELEALSAFKEFEKPISASSLPALVQGVARKSLQPVAMGIGKLRK